ncbi:MAG: efflux RND transporter periplasmic adaptor subunit [Verrucomicrobiota bacterium]
MNEDKLQQLRIQADARRRPSGTLWGIVFGVLLVTGVALYLYRPWDPEKQRLGGSVKPPPGVTNTTENSARVSPSGSSASRANAPDTANVGVKSSGATEPRADSVLTVSGYIINRERIEISPRFMGQVRWIGVRKGDAVTNGQVVVRLDDSEYQARWQETQARLEGAQVGVTKAELDLKRAEALVKANVEMQKSADDARLQLDIARATVREIEGQLQLLKVYLDWTIIRSPLNGVVLEKLVEANEMVTPQSFGGARGISTALMAVADPSDLQVEIDLNETDVAKIHLNQRCRVSPEAYPDHAYEGYVAEISPEASRQKGTLQLKVQIKNPDRFLTPELSAKVDFLK